MTIYAVPKMNIDSSVCEMEKCIINSTSGPAARLVIMNAWNFENHRYSNKVKVFRRCQLPRDAGKKR